ncbi:MAG: hypothetical protein ACLSA6_13865 [Holdemania massiliensis]
MEAGQGQIRYMTRAGVDLGGWSVSAPQNVLLSRAHRCGLDEYNQGWRRVVLTTQRKMGGMDGDQRYGAALLSFSEVITICLSSAVLEIVFHIKPMSVYHDFQFGPMSGMPSVCIPSAVIAGRSVKRDWCC